VRRPPRLRGRPEVKRPTTEQEPDTIGSANFAGVVHELKVHQIELEQQNDELRRARNALEESRQKFSDLYDFAPAGYLTLDQAGLVVQANLTAAGMLGLPLHRLIDRPFVKFLSPASHDAYYLSRRTKPEHLSGEFVLRKADGTFFTGDLVSRQLPNDRLQVVILDVSERKRLEQERGEETRRKDEFLAFLGHELRNPLAAIHTATQVLTGNPTPAVRARMEDTISQQTSLMRRLVDDLLELERITHGHIELRLGGVDLAECLERAVAAVQSMTGARHQELRLRLPPEPVRFMADGARLDQIVGNLLTNASKYTGRGGRIELSGAHEGSDVVIRCKDNGQGILREHQQKIFEPFVRERKAGFSHGEASVGLGLALVKQMTELHGGTVSVESAGADLGSEFTVRFPFVIPPQEQAVQAVPTHPRAPRRARSVAIVEDNPSVAVTLKAALEQAGHAVQVFADAPSALAAASVLKPDAFVIDIGLPGMDGYELADMLKWRPDTKDALRIAVSGFKQPIHRGAGAFDHYFNKPVDMASLLAVLDEPLTN
jgi:PAS domain S-box-containing protein